MVGVIDRDRVYHHLTHNQAILAPPHTDDALYHSLLITGVNRVTGRFLITQYHQAKIGSALLTYMKRLNVFEHCLECLLSILLREVINNYQACAFEAINYGLGNGIIRTAVVL
jgi:hypothetical protein